MDDEQSTDLEMMRTDPALEEILQQVANAPDCDLPAAAHSSAAWPRIDGYELLDELGHGGMGVVYRAVQSATGQTVALKVMSWRVRHHAESRQRFEREIRVLARLRHPHIATLHAAGTTDEGHPYFAMELIEGRTLDQFLLEAEPDRALLLRLFLQICDAMSASHRFGVIHRDLKPRNIVVCDGATQLKLLDFGLARMFEPDSDEAETLTRPEALQGTLAYMSPEQVSGQPVTTQSDVYALGVIFYEMLAGRRPYDVTRVDLRDAVRAICEDRPKAPSLVPSTGPRSRDLDAIALRALEKEPSRRYASVAELAADVENALHRRPVQARRIRSRVLRGAYRLSLFCRRHAPTVALASAAALALTAQGLWSVQRIEEQRLAAEHSAHDAQQRLAELYEEQGRQELLSDDPLQASVYLAEAYRLRPERSSLPFLLGRATRAFDARRSLTLQGSPGVLHSSAFLSPDGQRVAMIRGGSVRIVDARTGLELVRLAEDGQSWSLAAFSPDGARLATLGSAAAAIWDAASGRKLLQLEEPREGAAGALLEFLGGGAFVGATGVRGKTIWDARSGKRVAFVESLFQIDPGYESSPQRTRILTLGTDRVPQLYDLEAGTTSLKLEEAAGARQALLSPDGSRILVVSSGSGTAQLWDAGRGTMLFELAEQVPAQDKPLKARFSPDGLWIVTTGFGRPPRVWSAVDGRLAAELEGEEFLLLPPTFTADGRRLVGISQRQSSVKLWERSSGKLLGSFQAPGTLIALPSPDGSHVVTAGPQGTTLWPLQTLLPAVTLESGTSEPLEAPRFSPDGLRIATKSPGGKARLWDAASGRKLAELAVPSSAWDTTFHPDGRWIVASSKAGRLRLLDGASAEPVAELSGAPATIWAARFSPGGSRFLALGLDGRLAVWDTSSRERLIWLEGPAAGLPWLLASSPDGSLLLAPRRVRAVLESWIATADAALRGAGCHLGMLLPGTTRLKDLPIAQMADELELRTVQGSRLVASLGSSPLVGTTFSPDGASLLAATMGNVSILEAASGRSLGSLEDSSDLSGAYAFSPDGAWILAGGSRGPVRLLESRSGRLLAVFREASRAIEAAVFSPDGTSCALQNKDGSVTLLELPRERRSPEAFLRLVRCHAPWKLEDGRLVPASPDLAACSDPGR